ncbi:MAG TPA: sialidase family protein [Actinomycetota bacterium]|nr:sialidase family protein [Actinomycetota bacterium]
MPARTISGLFTLLAMVVVAAALVLVMNAPSAVRGPGRAPGGNEERLEQQLTTDLRLDALREARAAGTFGTREQVVLAAAPGWAGEQLMNVSTDDWEPAIAADPNAPFVYMVTTRYAPKPCPGNCPSPWMALEISSDGGATWGPGVPLCACKGSAQFDPIIEVVPNTGHVYALYMNGFNTVFLKSTNHGQTWSAPVPTYGKVSWTDKPVLAMSNDGQHIYVSWNGPNAGDPYIAQSHDFGATWTQTKIDNGPRYYFAYDADVLPNGTVVFSESSILYGGQGSTPEGLVQHHAIVSTNQGASWSNVVVDAVEIGESCVAAGCTSDFYIGHSGVSADASGNLVMVYDGATTPGGKQLIFSKRSTNGGLAWSARSTLSPASEQSTAPVVESRGAGDVRMWFAQTNGGNHDAWNIWYRSSTDGGVTWAAAVNISDAISGAAYKTAAGFQEFYGDYGEIAITNTGKTIGVWGEAFSYTGPGGTWFNRQI